MAFKIATIEKRFKSPGPQPNGLQATPEGLWIIDQVDLKVYLVDWETGGVLFEAQTDTEHSSGITLGGGFMWVASTFELQIAKLNPQTGETIEKLDSPGSGIVAWAADPSTARTTGAHGLEWRNGKVYIAVPPSQKVHVMNAETWAEESSFRTPGLRNHGLAWEDDKLWVADTSAGTVCLLDPQDGRVLRVIRVDAPDEVHGLTIHEGVLWYCDASNREIGRLVVT
jgi:streptogramin lyase